MFRRFSRFDRLGDGQPCFDVLLPLAAATAVLLFAVGSFSRAASNRSLVAHLEVGATESC